MAGPIINHWQAGSTSTPTPTPTRTHFFFLGCNDTPVWVDSCGDGCEWYEVIRYMRKSRYLLQAYLRSLLIVLILHTYSTSIIQLAQRRKSQQRKHSLTLRRWFERTIITSQGAPIFLLLTSLHLHYHAFDLYSHFHYIIFPPSHYTQYFYHSIVVFYILEYTITFFVPSPHHPNICSSITSKRCS